MIVQYIILFLILATAVWYVVRKIREPFRSKKACGEACGKCQALDKLEEVKKS
jgi:large-conductance mechanosensitive channel